jgi:hypothetical protein
MPNSLLRSATRLDGPAPGADATRLGYRAWASAARLQPGSIGDGFSCRFNLHRCSMTLRQRSRNVFGWMPVCDVNSGMRDRLGKRDTAILEAELSRISHERCGDSDDGLSNPFQRRKRLLAPFHGVLVGFDLIGPILLLSKRERRTRSAHWPPGYGKTYQIFSTIGKKSTTNSASMAQPLTHDAFIDAKPHRGPRRPAREPWRPVRRYSATAPTEKRPRRDAACSEPSFEARNRSPPALRR